MKKIVLKGVATILVGGLTGLTATAAMADEWPFVGGDYWEVTGIDIADGGGWKYANWLADEWRKNAEFAKSQGWIKDYMVIANVHNRADEPDLYLIQVIEYVPSGSEGEERQKKWMEFQSKSIEQMVGESGNRAEYRTVMSSSLLQVLKFRD